MKLQNINLVQLQELAAELAKKYEKKPVIIGLIGQLGAGKTTFVKAFVKKFGNQKVKSPSFVISHQYPFKKQILYHLDFYRLENKKQLLPLNLEEILNHKHLVLMEWVDKFPELTRKCDIIIRFQINSNKTRNVVIQNRKN